MGARWPITILVLFFYTSKGNINTVNSIYSSLIVVLRCYFCILPFSLETATSWSGLIILPFRHSAAANFYELCLPFLAYLKTTFLPFSQNTVPSHNITIIAFIYFFCNLFSWYVSCSLCMVNAVTQHLEDSPRIGPGQHERQVLLEHPGLILLQGDTLCGWGKGRGCCLAGLQ